MARTAEELIARLAARQHGLVTRAQLLRAGLSSRQVERCVAAARLRPVHRGVYQVGPLPLPRAREMAAVLACGANAYLSHRSAAAVWGLLPSDAPSPVHVLVVGRDGGRRPGIVAHRVSRLRRSEVTRIEAIPITTPTRTLLDLAATVSARELEQALAEAMARRLVSRAALRSATSRRARCRGIGVLRRLLEDPVGPALARSEAEERFLALIRKAQIPGPEANAWVAGHQVDFVWRAERLVVEVDGRAFHSSARSFERDRRRDADLAALGFRVIRVTWNRIVHEPEALLVRLAQALARSG